MTAQGAFMNARPIGYVRTTITIPHDLKRRMERERTVNWSAVACDAFEAKLSELSSQPGAAMSDNPSVDDAIERLRRLKDLPEAGDSPRDFESGFQAGRRWAMATATPQELGRLESFSQQAASQWPLLDTRRGKEVLKKIAQVVTGLDTPVREMGKFPRGLRDFWPMKVGLLERPDDCLSFARGFCDGAMQFWKDAKDKI
jgi:hypothetical protein